MNSLGEALNILEVLGVRFFRVLFVFDHRRALHFCENNCGFHCSNFCLSISLVVPETYLFNAIYLYLQRALCPIKQKTGRKIEKNKKKLIENGAPLNAVIINDI